MKCEEYIEPRTQISGSDFALQRSQRINLILHKGGINSHLVGLVFEEP